MRAPRGLPTCCDELFIKNHQRNKQRYDQKVKLQVLEKGDCVLIRKLAHTGKHKLEDKWDSLPYLVVEKLQGMHWVPAAIAETITNVYITRRNPVFL